MDSIACRTFHAHFHVERVKNMGLPELPLLSMLSLSLSVFLSLSLHLGNEMESEHWPSCA